MTIMRVPEKDGNLLIDIKRIMAFGKEYGEANMRRYIVYLEGGVEFTIYTTRPDQPHMLRDNFVAAWANEAGGINQLTR